jgi:hypothetical protein
LHSQSNPNRGAGASPIPASVFPMPGWVKVFAFVALVVIAVVAALHFAGVGMGHLAQDGMDAHAPLAGHGQHRP